jgi:hypothetical protein
MIAYILFYRLFEILREKKGVVYTPVVKYASMLHIGHICFKLQTSATTIPVLLKTVKEEISKLQKLTEKQFREELAAFKHSLEGANVQTPMLIHVENSMYDKWLTADHITLPHFKETCKTVFQRHRCAFKFHTKSSLAMCLENTY